MLTWQNALSGTFARFHRDLENAINETRWGIPLSAVIFSDSFFLASSTFSGAMEFCESFMRTCICGMLPMRIGVGFGSFVTHKFSYQSTSFAQISTAQFLGTGVTNAAERCSHRGMRVFLQGTGSIASVRQGVILASPEDSACDKNAEGALRYSRELRKMPVCDGARWQALQTEPVTPQ